MKTVNSKKELKAAIKNNTPYIHIADKELARHIKIMMQIPEASFIAAGGFIAAAVAGALITKVDAVSYGVATGFTSTAITFGGSLSSAAVAVPIIGLKATTTLVILGIGLGGFSIVQSLFNKYTIYQSGYNWVEIKLK